MRLLLALPLVALHALSLLWSRFVAGCATLPEWDGGWMDWYKPNKD